MKFDPCTYGEADAADELGPSPPDCGSLHALLAREIIVTVSEGDRLRQARDRAGEWLERYGRNHEPEDLRAATLRLHDFLEGPKERRRQPRRHLRLIAGGKRRN